MRWLLIGVCGVGVVVLGWFYFTLLQPVNPGAAPVLFEVQPGESGRSVLRRLVDQGLIKHELSFRIYARLTGLANQIRVGEYELSAGQSPIEIKGVLASGKSVERPLTVQEGLNVFEIAELFESQRFGTRQEFLSVAFDAAYVRELLGEDLSSFEGYLFPDTYRLTRFTGARRLVAQMVENFKRNYELALKSMDQAQTSQSFTRHQLVTFASLVEKETGAPEERPLISSVFHNRLRKRMRLQSDPTIIYGMARESGQIPENIRKADILRPTPYNTYTVPALPYGPIANPGLASLQASVRPETSEYLFFVSRNDGTHVFSKTYKEHNAAVVFWQKTRANREGRSWRDRTQEQRK